jgi:hypothetical protein
MAEAEAIQPSGFGADAGLVVLADERMGIGRLSRTA